MAGQGVNLRQGFHDKAGMIVVDKIAYSIHGVIPRAVRVLLLQDEIQISFCYLPVIIVQKTWEALVSKKAR